MKKMTQIKGKKQGRPPSFERRIINKILKELPDDGSPIRSTNLRENVGVSPRILFKYLNYLCNTFQIEKNNVHSEKGKGVEYRKCGNLHLTWDFMIKRMRGELKKSSPSTLKFHTEYDHAFYLSYLIATMDVFIIDALRRYSKSGVSKAGAISKRDKMSEGDLEVLKEMFRKMTSLGSKSIGMTDFTYIMTRIRIPLLLMNADPDKGREEFAKMFNIKMNDPNFAKIFNLEKVDLDESEDMSDSVDDVKK